MLHHYFGGAGRTKIGVDRSTHIYILIDTSDGRITTTWNMLREIPEYIRETFVTSTQKQKTGAFKIT